MYKLILKIKFFWGGTIAPSPKRTSLQCNFFIYVQNGFSF